MPEPAHRPNAMDDYVFSRVEYQYMTLCTKAHAPLLGRICPSSGNAGRPEMQLSAVGRALEETLQRIARQEYKNVTVVDYIILPNHIHMMLVWRVGEQVKKLSPLLTSEELLALLQDVTSRAADATALEERCDVEAVRNADRYMHLLGAMQNNVLLWEHDPLNEAE